MPDIEVTAAVLGRIIVQAGRILDVPFGEVLERYGLTRNAWWLLTELYRTRDEEPAAIGEYARRSGLAASSATIATEQLTKRKLVRRRQPKDNRRTTLVNITGAGVSLVESARSDLERSVAGLYDLFDSDDRRLLQGLLTRIVTRGVHRSELQV
ncbi:hypothetical protein Aph02nite_32740 [Actinoplanes philippinensis]|uniref:DNA-binding transcriptional regulator, MarR family n=1 Tax=Actinoplanes philippinensis TaxID=35752 RepID=A0A1I2E205_9ACTN|nr:MarR family transcriptional regulator [Actinoplanes philippinensis]GIE77324.1 hypothetical protein Aph02nite_32740 [Actinoplanes philippinensis]SFE86729.1 DNA-binding transcriptional regulator, MarR family [Actinoplanes philippinensis]